MKRLAIIGGGGFAKEVREISELLGHSVEAYFAEDESNWSVRYMGKPELIPQHIDKFEGVVVAFGAVNRRTMQRRNALCQWLEEQGVPTPSLVSPKTIIGPGAEVSDGAIVAHGVILGPDSRIGRFALLNSGAAVGHDATVGYSTVLAPYSFVGGATVVGDRTLLGPGVRVLQGLKIGSEVVAGMGVSIFQNLPAGATVWPSLPRIQKKKSDK